MNESRYSPYKKTPKKVFVNLDSNHNSRNSSFHSISSSGKKWSESLRRSGSQPDFEIPSRRSRQDRKVEFPNPASYATFIQKQHLLEEINEQIALINAQNEVEAFIKKSPRLRKEQFKG